LTATPSSTPTVTATNTITNTSTQTATNTITNTPTVTATLTLTNTPTLTPRLTETLPFNLSPTGILSLGPNLAQSAEPICLFVNKPDLSSQWDIYDIAGELVAPLSFGSGEACWSHPGIASGLYLVRVRVNYQDGTTADKIFKVIILR
jgi:hypothetical protein